MKIRRRDLTLIVPAGFAIFLAASFSAWGWGPTGHRVTAELAQRHLSPPQASSCSLLLGGYDLADVANWSDEVRDDPKYKVLQPLHFADFPKGVTRYQDAPHPPEGDVVQAVNVLTAYLKTGNAEVLKAIPAFAQIPMDQGVALKLLVHFVGDIHQPLHVGFDGELGGNKTRVKWMGGANVSLHEIWDELMIDHERLSYTEFANFLNHISPEELAKLRTLDPAEWANESIALHDQLYTFPDEVVGTTPQAGPPPPPGGKPDPHPVSWKYISNNRETLRRQLLKGGIHLAYLLNSIFPNSVELPKP